MIFRTLLKAKLSVVSEGGNNVNNLFYMSDILGLARLRKGFFVLFFFLMCESKQRTHSSFNTYFLSRGGFYVYT